VKKSETQIFKTEVQLNQDKVLDLAGAFDENLKYLQTLTHTTIERRGNLLKIHGSEQNVNLAVATIRELEVAVDKGVTILPEDIKRCALSLSNTENKAFADIVSEGFYINSKKVYPKTHNQSKYLKAMSSFPVIFGLGPAGSGKTYLAVAVAVYRLFKKIVKKIIFCRPAVEAGEKLGFLPGTLEEKIDPYMRPLFDALFEFLEAEKIEDLIHKGQLEVAPLAFMRGRTLANCFVILDEAQNTTTQQMKMFLTRLGHNSTFVINGDPTQIDLPNVSNSGLLEATEILRGIPEIAFIEFTKEDCLRHPIVEQILEKYEKTPKKNKYSQENR